MAALTSNRNKRELDSQSGFSYDHHQHINKKFKPSNWVIKAMDCVKSSVSRLRLYPKHVTPIVGGIQAPCSVVRGFGGSNKFSRLDNSNKGYENPRRMDCGLFTEHKREYDRLKEAAKDSCRYVKFDMEDEVVEVVNIDDDVKNVVVNEENDGSGGSGVEEVVMMEGEREDGGDKLGEVQTIRAKYRELDGMVEGNVGFRASSSANVLDGKALESLSLKHREGVSLPYHKKLYNDSAVKHDSRISRRNFDIKLLEEKRALLKELTPVKKEEDTLDDQKIEPFRPLTDDEAEMVDNALSNSSRRKVLVTHENSNITITGEVLQCLRPGAWLNDEVINLYLELVKERERREPKKFLRCHFFNTFFYKKLISGRAGYDYKSVRRWTTQRKLGYSLLECDKIFIPVHKEIHWCLAVINKKEEKFQYLDSLGGGDKQVMRVLAKYFVDEVKDKNGEDIDVTSWKQEFVSDLPNQQNGFDCGVFMIKYADFYSRDIGLCFDQEHMPYFRKRTAKEILKLRAD